MLDDGEMIEVATSDGKGMLGISAIFDGDPSPSATRCKLRHAETDTCYKMPVAAFRSEMGRHEMFHDIIKRFSQAVVGFVMQSTACNAIHSVEQRLARWLLMAHDRVGRNIGPAVLAHRDDRRSREAGTRVLRVLSGYDELTEECDAHVAGALRICVR